MGAGWIQVAAFQSLGDGQSAMQSLILSGVPADVRTAMGDIPTYRHVGPCYVWVPEELIEDAKWVLDKPAVSGAELERLALEDPPPDDA